LKIISFARTSEALLAFQKSVTRRYWKDSHGNGFKPDELVQAWDKSPRYGGRKIAIIKIIAVYKEKMIDAPEEDYKNEGFQFMCDHSIYLYKIGNKKLFPIPGYWRAWRTTTDEKFKIVWVIRFEILKTFLLPKI